MKIAIVIGSALALTACDRSAPPSEPEPIKLTAEQSRLYGKCVEAYDDRGHDLFASTNIFSWCERALKAGVPEAAPEYTTATAMRKVGEMLMQSPFDRDGEEAAEAEVARIREATQPATQ